MNSQNYYKKIDNTSDEQIYKLQNYATEHPVALKYEGYFNKKNQRHGIGKMIYKSGAIYDGEWIENKKCGSGI